MGLADEHAQRNGTDAGDDRSPERLASAISELLISIYNSVDVVEGKMFKRMRGLGVTMSEARIIQLVGDETFHTGRRMTVSQLAAAALVTTSSMTAGVNRLADRGFLAKERDESDGRCVNVRLTERGEKAYRLHTIFHMRMASAVLRGMSAEDARTFQEALERLADFYRTEEEK